MQMNAYIAGVGMTRFGKHLDTTLKGLAGEAIREALADAGLTGSDLQVAYMGNAAGGVVQGQEMISGQVALRELGIGRIPVINVENACATSSTAFNQACAMVSAGLYDVALVCGFEKLFHEDKARSFAAFDGAVDTENTDGIRGSLEALATMAGEVERARAATDLAVAAAADHGFAGSQTDYAVTVAKVTLGEVVPSVVTAAHQLHGAIGVTIEHRLWLATMRARSWNSEFGDTAHYAQRLGRLVLSAADPWDVVIGSGNGWQ